MRESSYLKDNQKILEKLKEIKFFKPFNDEDLHSFLDLGKLKEYDPGEIIIQEGEFDCWVYFLLSGQIEIIKNGKVMGILKRKGEIFGEMGVVDGSPRSATIRAAAKSLTLSVDGSLMDRKYKENELTFSYTVFRLFSEVLAHRLRITTEENTRLKEEIEKLKNFSDITFYPV